MADVQQVKSFRLSDGLRAELRAYARRHGITDTQAIQEALRQYLGERKPERDTQQ